MNNLLMSFKTKAFLAIVILATSSPVFASSYRIKGDIPQSKSQGVVKTVKIKGKVVDEQGNPLLGASVYVNESSSTVKRGTSCSEDGSFTLLVSKDSENITVSMLGYKTQKVKIDGNMFLTIVMKPEAQKIDQVVCTGYMDKKAESFTGSVFTVTKENLNSVKGVNLLAAMQMFVPGMEITENNLEGSNPNVLPDIVIRGRSSFSSVNGKNQPLFILDGFEVELSTIYDLDVNEVESVTVLKDAAATAFYGANASNGVIVVTTNVLKSGKLTVNYNGSVGMTQPDLSSYDLLNAAEKLEYERLAGVYDSRNAGSKYELEKQYNEKYKKILKGIDSDWLSQPLRTGINQKHSLRIYGGEGFIRYSLGANYNLDEGVMKESKRQNQAFTFKLSYNKNNKFLFENRMSVSRVKQNHSPYGKFSDYSKLNPYDRIYNEDGTYNTELSYGMKNPLYEANIGSFDKSDGLRFINNFAVKWNLSDALRLQSNISMEWYREEGEKFISPLSTLDENKNLPEDKKGIMNETLKKNNKKEIKIFLAYNKYFGSGNHLNFNLGANVNEKTYDDRFQKSVGYLSPKLNHVQFGNAYPTSEKPSGRYLTERNIGAFSNINFSIKDIYFVDGSLRYDGSSKYGKDARNAILWSLGAGWNIQKELWCQDNFIDLLRVRASIGEDGNSSFYAYQAIATYAYSGDYNYMEGIGAMPVAMANPDLKWEKAFKQNIGVNFAFFKNYISGSIDFYKDITNNLLLGVTMPPSIGFAKIKENLGKIENKGWEISLDWRIFKNKDMNCIFSINSSHNTNKIKEISNSLKKMNEEINEDSDKSRLPLALYEEGESTTALKVVRSAGIDPITGQEVYIKKNGELTYVYDYKDKVVVGDKSPKIQGAGGLSFSYKQFGIFTRFSYRLGAENYNTTLADKIEGVNVNYNADRRVLTSRWHQPGDIVKFKKYDRYGLSDVNATDRFVKTEYMIDIRSISLSYELTRNTCEKLSMKNLRFNLTMNNIGRLSTIEQERGFNYPFAYNFLFSVSAKF